MDGLVAFGKAHGMKHAVYGSLGEPVALPELLSNPTLKAIASLRSRTVEEVKSHPTCRSATAPAQHTVHAACAPRRRVVAQHPYITCAPSARVRAAGAQGPPPATLGGRQL
eukprot:6865130-Prymnesium_polylepis.1